MIYYFPHSLSLWVPFCVQYPVDGYGGGWLAHKGCGGALMHWKEGADKATTSIQFPFSDLLSVLSIIISFCPNDWGSAPEGDDTLCGGGGGWW